MISYFLNMMRPAACRLSETIAHVSSMSSTCLAVTLLMGSTSAGLLGSAATKVLVTSVDMTLSE